MNVFDLFAKISLDTSEYTAGLQGAEQQTSSFGDKLKKGLATTAKVGMASIAAISAGAIKLTKDFSQGIKSVAAYGDQIDKESQKLGISAEAYQEWDAVLQHSGTSISSLSASMRTLVNAADSGNEAFQKLGITQEQIAEMSQEELFSAVISALQEMGESTERAAIATDLLGRGAQELAPLLNTSAEETQAMKDAVHELGGVLSDEAVKSAAAFQDTLQDLTTAFSGLKNSFFAEFLPMITQVMQGLTDLFGNNPDSAIEKISAGVESFITRLSEKLPELLSVGKDILMNLVKAIIKNLPQLVKAAVEIIMELANDIIEQLPALIDVAIELLMTIVEGLTENLPVLIPALVNAILYIVEKLTEPEMLTNLIGAALQLILALAEGLVNAIPQIVQAIPTIIQNLVQAIIQNAPQMLSAAWELIKTLAEGLWSYVTEAVSAIGDVFGRIKDGFIEKIEDAKQWGKDLIQKFIDGIKEKWQKLKDAVSNVAQSVKDFLGFSEPEKGPLSDFHTYAPDMMKLFAKGIDDNDYLIDKQIEKTFDIEGKIGGAEAQTASASQPITIVVQSVLDGRIIGENVYDYINGRKRAYGV